MTDRLYEVSVTQAFELIHIVRAPNKREARRIIQDLTRGRVERDDPRLVESFASAHVGPEKVNTLVVRVGEVEARATREVRRQSKPIHDEGCIDWCNHCSVCGASILYGSRCGDHEIERQS